MASTPTTTPAEPNPPLEAKTWSSEVNKVRLTLLIALLFTTLGAGVFQTPSLILMTALLLGAPFVGIFVSRIASRRLAVTRRLPTMGTVGDIITGEIVVRNEARWPLFMVHLQTGDAVFREGGEEVTAVVPLEGDDLVAPVVRAGAAATWRQNWRLQRRGVFRVSPARAGVLDPIGLYTRLAEKTGSQPLTVLPRPVRVAQLSFLDSATAGKQTPQHAVAVADATDFHGVRPWRPGEGLRRVHWKSTARTGQLHVVEWEEALASDTSILLDTQAISIAGYGAESSLEVGITLVASIAAYLLENGYGFEMFHWGQTGDGKSTARMRLPFRQRAADEAEAPPRLQHFRAGNASQVGNALIALAQLQPVHSVEATLPRLCEQAGPLIAAGRSVVIVASSLADIEAAMHTVKAGLASGANCQVLLLDADSFAGSAPAPSAATARLPAPGRQIKVVRRGDSLAAILERKW